MSVNFTTCTSDDFIDKTIEGVKSFTSFTASLGEKADTRIYLSNTAQEGKICVIWNEDDEIAMLSDLESDFKTFHVSSITEDNIATFNGEAISGKEFYAYYPNSDGNLFVEKGNHYILHASLEGDDFNLGEKNNIPMVAVSDGNILAFKQVTGLVHITIGGIYRLETCNLYGNYNEVLYGKGTIDLSEDNPVFKLDNKQDTNKVLRTKNRVGDEQLLGNDMVDIYFNLPPMTFWYGFTLEVRGYDKNGNSIIYKKTTSSNQIINRAEVIHYTLANVEEEYNALNNIIEFADDEVKAICINNWDKNKDGELSHAEAAAVKDIGNKFYGKDKIKSFDEFQYFKNIKSVQDEAFMNCTALESIVLPNSLRDVKKEMFRGCKKLKNVTIPVGVVYIGFWAFRDCSSLTSIVIPEGVTSIGGGAFWGCMNLTNIEIPESVTSISSSAFRDCSSLTNIVIPKNVTTIEWYTFRYCSSLTSIVIPEGVTRIEMGAFSDCISLTNIDIPKSVTDLDSDLGATFAGCSSLTSIVIPEGVPSIGNCSFYDCSNLTNIVLPKSLKTIEDRAFWGCSSLVSITCMAANPPSIHNEYVFSGVKNVSLYVPSSSVDAYTHSYIWSTIANQIMPIEE